MTNTAAALANTANQSGSADGKSRDAQATRQRLLTAARRRFAHDGYSSTTVREIASDAGVNVALINRYFASKEGLFEACLEHAAEGLVDPDDGEVTVEQVARTIVARIAGAPSGEQSVQLLLLLRSSGDERADLIRRATLESFARRIATVIGWQSDAPGADELMLRAQIALATGLGVVLMRTTIGPALLAGATEGELADSLHETYMTLLTPGPATAASRPRREVFTSASSDRVREAPM